MKKSIFILYFLAYTATLLAQGQLIEKTIMVDGIAREYLLYVPAAYDGSEAWPFVLNFHGYLSKPKRQMAATSMNAVADTAHFLVAYPKGLKIDISTVANRYKKLPKRGNGWNIYGALSGNDDLAFVNGIIDETEATYNVNSQKIYATGMSLGAIMTHYLACELNGRIAAIASVVGGLQDDERFDCDPVHNIPVLIMAGTADDFAPYDGRLNGIGPEATARFWRTHNGCSADSTVTTFEDQNMGDGSTVTRFTYKNCNGNAEVVFYKIEGGGHTWAGDANFPGMLGNVNRDIQASSEIWNFFNRHELPQNIAVKTEIPKIMDLEISPSSSSEQVAFSFDLPKQAQVQLTILNTMGQQVQSLYDGPLPQGSHRLTWDSSNEQLSAGTYFYRLRINDQTVSLPVTLIR